MDELATIQARFAAGLLDGDVPPVALFKGNETLTRRRFALYRGNLTAHWERALGNAYPVIRRMVGDEFFRAMAREYGRTIPHEDGDLNRFGGDLAAFLAAFAPVAPYPYLPDMARLEWALHLAHQAADVPVLCAEELARLDLAALDTLRVGLHPAVTLVDTPWAIDALWQAHQQESVQWPGALETQTHIAVCRPHWRAELMSLSAGEAAALTAIAAGAALGPALEIAADADPDFNPAEALPRWLAKGLLTLTQEPQYPEFPT